MWIRTDWGFLRSEDLSDKRQYSTEPGPVQSRGQKDYRTRNDCRETEYRRRRNNEGKNPRAEIQESEDKVSSFFYWLYSPCGLWSFFSLLIYSQSVGLL
jgi:hypothetical protein